MKKQKLSSLNFGSMASDFQVARRFFALVHHISPVYIPLKVFTALIEAAFPFLRIIMPKFIIDELMGQQRPEMFLLYAGVLIIGDGLMDILYRIFSTKVHIANEAMVDGFEMHLGKRILHMKYESLEDPEILDMKQKALEPITQQGAIWRMMYDSTGLIRATITLTGLVAIIATLDWILIGAVLVVVLLNTFIFKKQQDLKFKWHKILAPLNREFGYYHELSNDFSTGKDVRLYRMAPFLLRKVDSYHVKIVDILIKQNKKDSEYKGITTINTAVQTLVIYSYMVYKVFTKAIGIGDFTMYISAATEFSKNISQFFNNFISFRQDCRYLDLYMQFEQLPLRQDIGNESPKRNIPIVVEFRKVWFRYPRCEEYTLKDVSIKLHAGEKLSVVGPNGAGKTTFIKLLCRLYQPEQGQILLNGVDIQEIKYDEYMKLLAVVFQDYKLFSFTVKENIAFDHAEERADDEVLSAIKKAGLDEKLDALDKGIYTPIYKNFDEDGVEFSGGEAQKLAIARAIFKQAPIVVLDEPTAALDPFAEAEIYAKFNELVEDSAAVYISHRLSSCRFCDHIAVFDKGALSEYGTHEELVAHGGKYSEMWNAQAQYYT